MADLLCNVCKLGKWFQICISEFCETLYYSHNLLKKGEILKAKDDQCIKEMGLKFKWVQVLYMNRNLYDWKFWTLLIELSKKVYKSWKEIESQPQDTE